MKKTTLVLLLSLTCMGTVNAQGDRVSHKNFPLVITLEFHSLSLPFQNLKHNLSNIGIGLGTELYYGNNSSSAQRFSVVWYRNKAVGNGLLFYSQYIWRPQLIDDSFGELKAGIGYLISQRPVQSYKSVGSSWQSVGRKGKSMLTIPIGVGLGAYHYQDDTQYASFLSYQFLALSNYSRSVPVIPETLIQIGSSIQSNR